MKIVDSEAMSRIDQRAQAEFAIPSLVLMEDAGVKAWALIAGRIRGNRRGSAAGRKTRGPATGGGGRSGGRLLFIAGRGNNGGDALVMARQAVVSGCPLVTVILAGDRPGSDTDPGRNLAICEALGMECVQYPTQSALTLARLADARWVFDGIAGTGIRGALRAPLADLVKAVNESQAVKVAIDVPSGIGDQFRDGDPAVRADFTLTMGLPKRCLFLPASRAFCGRILVVPVGFPPALVHDEGIAGELCDRGAWRCLLPPIMADAHKGRRGHLAVFAGSRGTTGAAWLAASAAARCRLGLVSAFLDADAYPIVAPRLASVMAKPWVTPGPGNEASPRPTLDTASYSGFLVGPGWGFEEEKERWLEHLLSQQASGVIDADGITLLARIIARLNSRDAGSTIDARQAIASRKLSLAGRWILTPHPGEFARLTGIPIQEVLANPVDRALEASADLDAVIVLKSHCTYIATPGGKYWILDGMNPALGTGGSGDVLAGIIGAGIAGGLAPLDAALFGVSLHSHVGDVARKRLGWFLAEELVPLISTLIRQNDGSMLQRYSADSLLQRYSADSFRKRGSIQS